MSIAEKSTTLAERVLALSGFVGSAVLIGIVCYELGIAVGRDQANLQMWETPAGMSSCRVYPDGGKQCQKAFVPTAPFNRTECVRACVMRARLEKVQ